MDFNKQYVLALGDDKAASSRWTCPKVDFEYAGVPFKTYHRRGFEQDLRTVITRQDALTVMTHAYSGEGIPISDIQVTLLYQFQESFQDIALEVTADKIIGSLFLRESQHRGYELVYEERILGSYFVQLDTPGYIPNLQKSISATTGNKRMLIVASSVNKNKIK